MPPHTVPQADDGKLGIFWNLNTESIFLVGLLLRGPNSTQWLILMSSDWWENTLMGWDRSLIYQLLFEQKQPCWSGNSSQQGSQKILEMCPWRWVVRLPVERGCICLVWAGAAHSQGWISTVSLLPVILGASWKPWGALASLPAADFTSA